MNCKLKTKTTPKNNKIKSPKRTSRFLGSWKRKAMISLKKDNLFWALRVGAREVGKFSPGVIRVVKGETYMCSDVLKNNK